MKYSTRSIIHLHQYLVKDDLHNCGFVCFGWVQCVALHCLQWLWHYYRQMFFITAQSSNYYGWVSPQCSLSNIRISCITKVQKATWANYCKKLGNVIFFGGASPDLLQSEAVVLQVVLIVNLMYKTVSRACSDKSQNTFQSCFACYICQSILEYIYIW